MDFTEIQPSKTYRYLLVVVCTFTGWIEAYPTHMEKATELSRVLAKEIIPQFRVPSSIGSDNRFAFISLLMVKGISHAVGLTWDLHTQYHPQSSGQVERLNRTTKTALAKQCQETGLPWPEVLPLALFKIRCAPRKCGLSPFEVLYGWPPTLRPGWTGDLQEHVQIGLQKFLKGLVHASREIALHLGHPDLAPVTLRPLHSWSPGDWVWVKTPIRGTDGRDLTKLF
jgi:transposase InsO family protein